MTIALEVKMFSDAIDALGKVFAGIKALSELPKKERYRYLATMDEAYQLLDSTLILVMNRLDDVLETHQDREFLIEVARLDKYEDWYRAERELRLCRRLQNLKLEMVGIRAKLAGKFVVKDWDALLEQIQDVLTNEYELAQFLTNKFYELSELAKKSLGDGESVDLVRQQVEDFRNVLNKERRQLIKQELELYEII